MLHGGIELRRGISQTRIPETTEVESISAARAYRVCTERLTRQSKQLSVDYDTTQDWLWQERGC